jgi:ankyrin repeat protein
LEAATQKQFPGWKQDNRFLLHCSFAYGRSHTWLADEDDSIKNEVDPHLKGVNGKRAIHYAARYAFDTSIRWLLQEQRVDPYVRDDEGNSALHHAVMNTKSAASVCAVLLQHGEWDMNARNVRNETPIQRVKDISTMQILLQRGATLDPFLGDATDLEMIAQRAAYQDDVAVLKYALDNGISPDCAVRAGSLSKLLHIAGPNVARVLVARGASVNVYDANERTPLMCSIRFPSNDCLEMVKYFLWKGTHLIPLHSQRDSQRKADYCKHHAVFFRSHLEEYLKREPIRHVTMFSLRTQIHL